MKDDFQIVLVNIINLFKFNSVESIIKFILFVFLIVVASIVIHLVRKFISLSIEKKETENKNDQDIKQNIKYDEGYIQGAIDRKTEECNSDVIFNRINQATVNTIAPGNKTSNGNSNSSLTGTNGPKPVITTLPTNESLADNRLAYLKGYIDGHKDDKFWDNKG